jgi:hypothetical protein
VKVRCDEGIANHIGPEPCAVVREDLREASVGDRIGQPLSCEIDVILGAHAVLLVEGNMDGRAIASAFPPSAVVDPGMCGRSLRGNREISCLTRAARRHWLASGRRGAVAGDART